MKYLFTKLKSLSKKQKIISIIIGIIIVAGIVTTVVVVAENNKKQEELAQGFSIPDGYKSVDEKVYTLKDTYGKTADKEDSYDAYFLYSGQKVQRIAVNKKTGWSIIKIKGDDGPEYYYVKSKDLSKDKPEDATEPETATDEEGNIISGTESTESTEITTNENGETIVTGGTSSSNGSSNSSSGSNGSKNTTGGSSGSGSSGGSSGGSGGSGSSGGGSSSGGGTATQPVTSAPAPVQPSGWQPDLVNQVKAKLKSAYPGKYMMSTLPSEGVAAADAIGDQFSNGQIDSSTATARLNALSYPVVNQYGTILSYSYLENARALKLTVSGKDFDTIYNTVVGNAYYMHYFYLKVYYNGNSNQSTIYMLEAHGNERLP